MDTTLRYRPLLPRYELEIDKLFTVHYFEHDEDYCFTGERHDFWELFYVCRGDIFVDTDRIPAPLHLKQADIIFFRPGEFHRIYFNSITPCSIQVLTFHSPSPAMEYFKLHTRFRADEEICGLFEKIHREARSSFCYDGIISPEGSLLRREDAPFGGEQLLRAMLEMLLIDLIRGGRELESGQAGEDSAEIGNEYVNRAVAFMQANLSADISLEDVCDHLSISKSQLQKIFGRCVGTSVMRYLIHLRMEEAKILIYSGRMNFTEIAEQLCYSSVHHFSKQFRQTVGMTPTEYARSVRPSAKWADERHYGTADTKIFEQEAYRMTKKEIVIRTLEKKESGVIPYYLGMTHEVERRMVEHTGDPLFFEHSGSYLAQAANEILEDLGDGSFRDQFGVIWDRSEQEGDFGITRVYPIPESRLGDYVFPEPDEEFIREQCRELVTHNDKFTMYAISFSLYERLWTLHGIENSLMDFLEEPEFIYDLLDRITEYNCKVIDIVAQYPIDCIFFGDDWGQQKGLIMGYPLWKKFIKPHLKTLYDHVKKYGMYVAQHSCGDCRQVFPDLVELGLDIYNTFQPEVYDIVDFKKRFGHQITFFGGISTQTLLPFATPEELKKEMHRIMDILGRDGGYILAPTHAMPNDIPTENVLAFLDVARNENPR